MDIKNLKDFKALVKACQLLGVRTMRLGDIEFTVDPKRARRAKSIELTDPMATIPMPRYTPTVTASDAIEQGEITTDGPTEDEMLFWSAKEEPGV